jgi:hypothetical protein
MAQVATTIVTMRHRAKTHCHYDLSCYLRNLLIRDTSPPGFEWSPVCNESKLVYS